MKWQHKIIMQIEVYRPLKRVAYSTNTGASISRLGTTDACFTHRKQLQQPAQRATTSLVVLALVVVGYAKGSQEHSLARVKDRRVFVGGPGIWDIARQELISCLIPRINVEMIYTPP